MGRCSSIRVLQLICWIAPLALPVRFGSLPRFHPSPLHVCTSHMVSWTTSPPRKWDDQIDHEKMPAIWIWCFACAKWWGRSGTSSFVICSLSLNPSAPRFGSPGGSVTASAAAIVRADEKIRHPLHGVRPSTYAMDGKLGRHLLAAGPPSGGQGASQTESHAFAEHGGTGRATIH
jgi:hypothetical protein